MAILSSTGISGFLSSAKATGKQILNKAGKLIPEYVEDFVSGFAGHGWKIWNYRSEIDSENNELKKYKLEIDSLTVRESMTVFELLIQKIRAVKGALSITQASGKVATAVYDEEASEWLLTVEDEMSFAAHDIIRCQSWDNGTLKGYWVEISEIRKIEGVDTIVIPAGEFSGGIGYDKSNNNAECVDKALTDMITPAAGDEIIQFGNSKVANRQSAVYIHADEGGQPAIDILFGITTKSFAGCVKTRIGGDIPGGDGAKGFYCENGMIKCVDDSGSLIYEFKPDGSFTLGKRKIVYDPTEDKLKFGAGVTLTWDNIADDAKDHLKGDKGEKGDTGDPGTDGTSIEYIYLRVSKYSDYGTPPTPESSPFDNYIPRRWTDKPQGVTEMYPNEWISVRTKKKGSWSAFSTPALWSNWGKKGTDGDGYEYIYKQTSVFVSPDRPTEISYTDDYVPEGWTDDPQGVSESLPYEWVCTRKSKNGAWKEFSTPALWAKFGKDGQSGSDANVPDWLKEWDGYATDIGSGYIVTPSMFSGVKNSDGTLTGVVQGKDCIIINGVKRSGLYGLKDGNIVFSIDDAGNVDTMGSVIAKAIKTTGLNVNNKLMIDQDGKISAVDGEFTGVINADKGRIGKLLIKDNDLVGVDINGIERVKIGIGSVPNINDMFETLSVQFLMSSNDNDTKCSSGMSSQNYYTGSAERMGQFYEDRDPWTGSQWYNTTGINCVLSFQIDQLPKKITFSRFNIKTETISGRISGTMIINASLFWKDTTGKWVNIEKFQDMYSKQDWDVQLSNIGMYELRVTTYYNYDKELEWRGKVIFTADGIWITRSTASTGCTTIARDGILCMHGSNKYLMYSENNGFEARFNNYGLRVSSLGVQKLLNGVWVNL